MSAAAPPPAGDRRQALTLVAVIAGLGAAAVAVWGPWRDAPPPPPPPDQPQPPPRSVPADPRLTYRTPYRNVRPEVNYVGDAACAGCHPNHADTYHKHPMGRSLAPVAAAAPIERYDAAAHNPFAHGPFTYRVEQTGTAVRHAESAPGVEASAEVSFAVGSGQNGRAYLVNHAGYLFASPITWYPRKGRWDLSPGYERGPSHPHFGRPITPDCLFCHANHADHVSGTTNRYREPIFTGHAVGCERCHGPGELHVGRHTRGEKFDGLDDTIVNPADLEPALREAVCQQCHLQGLGRVWRRGRDTFDFRPGLPFHLVMTEFVRPPGEGGTKFVGSVEQMHASRCFQAGAGAKQMGCVSCHDPHSTPPPEKKIEFYRNRCLSCHQDRGCGVPLPTRLEQQKQDNCVACHMPPTGSNVNHTTITDHRILRRPDPAKPDDPSAASINLVPFHRDLLPAGDPEVERDLGIALMRVADAQRPDVGRVLAEKALPLLEAATARDDEDLPAWEARGHALAALRRPDAASAAYDRVLAKAPGTEAVLFRASQLSRSRRLFAEARTFADRAVTVNPWRWQYHQAAALASAEAKDWPVAERACREALKLNPADPNVRQLLVACLLGQGNKPAARREFDTLMGLNPLRPDELRRWFDRQGR